jgi:hypothetical protein
MPPFAMGILQAFIVIYFSMLWFCGNSHGFLLSNEVLQNLMSFASKLVNFRYF